MEACWSDLRRASAAVPLSLPARRIGGRWTPVLPPAPPGCSPSGGTNRRAAGEPSKGWSRTRPPSPRKSPPAAAAAPPADSCRRACTHLSEVSSACKKAFLPRPASPHNIQNSADDQVISLWSLSLWLAHRYMLRIHREGKLRRCWRRSGWVARRAPSLFLTASKLFSFFDREGRLLLLLLCRLTSNQLVCNTQKIRSTSSKLKLPSSGSEGSKLSDGYFK